MGAQRADVMQFILAQSMRPVALGVAIGLAVSAVALLAGYLPAQRASRVDPMTALRHS